jgi:glucose-6-phosphate isomerase
MALQNINPTQTQAWQNLENHFESMKNNGIKEMFQKDSNRAEQFHIQWNDFLVDFSKNNITSETMRLLTNLANEAQLKDAISKYFEGDTINQTENRAVLHTALRAPRISQYKSRRNQCNSRNF